MCIYLYIYNSPHCATVKFVIDLFWTSCRCRTMTQIHTCIDADLMDLDV